MSKQPKTVYFIGRAFPGQTPDTHNAARIEEDGTLEVQNPETCQFVDKGFTLSAGDVIKLRKAQPFSTVRIQP